jgi:endogenous inhibitor of DNA gyrase (YacG/DUF329 family)
MKRKCPICGKAVAQTLPDGQPNIHVPFCCQRCQLIDLGAWLDGRYKVPVEPDEPDDGGDQDEERT